MHLTFVVLSWVTILKSFLESSSLILGLITYEYKSVRWKGTDAKENVDLPTLAAKLAQQNAVFIGYCKYGQNGKYLKPKLNPPKWNKDGTPTEITFGYRDYIITIANQNE